MSYNFKGFLTDKEWKELIALEYILTWGYTHDFARDEKRYKELSNKKILGVKFGNSK